MTRELLDALDQTWGGLRSLLAEVGDDEWNLPTPCTEWSVRDLAAHLGAIESQFQGLPQPATEPVAPDVGIDGWTAAGVRARQSWTVDQLRDEIDRAAEAQLSHLRGLTDEGWQDTRFGPRGETTEEGLARVRTVDLYFHLLDLRSALARPLAFDAEPAALTVCVDWAMGVTPWGAAKAVGLDDGTRIRLDLGDPGARCADVVVEAGRGRMEPAHAPVNGERITGPAPAYLLSIGGRTTVAAAAGGVEATGAAAARFLREFRVFG